MRRALVLMTTLLVACGPQPTRPNCNRVSVIDSEQPPGASLTNQSVTVPLLGLSDIVCATGGPTATDVFVEVRDEQNLVVAETHTPPKNLGNGFSTEVTFTPNTPGVYFLEARFEPAVAATQRRHIVVRDRGAQQPEVISTVDARCELVYPMVSALICKRRLSDDLTFWVDGGVVDTMKGAIDSDDGVTWVRDFDVLRRLQVIDGGLHEDELAVEASSPIGIEPDQLIIAAPSAVTHVTFVDGGLQTRVRTFPEDLGLQSAGRIAVSGDNFAWRTDTQLCVRAATTQCRTVATEFSLAERDALWLKTTGAVSGIAQWRVFPDGMARLRAVTTSPVMLDVSRELPLLSWNGRFITVRRDDLTLEAWPKVDQTEVVTVTPSHVVFKTRSHDVRVYRR